MQEVYLVLDEADMFVLTSPFYYHSFTVQLQCVINRIHALDNPKKLKKVALLFPLVALYMSVRIFLKYLKLVDTGIFTTFDKQDKPEQTLEAIKHFGKS